MKINELKKTYEGRLVLNVQETEIPDGKITAVIGTNGSGKSTFAKILCGIIKADEKTKPFEIKATDEIKKGKNGGKYAVGYLPQKPYAFNMSVEKNLNIAGEAGDEICSRLKIDQLKKENAKKLSGGENARMALGRILAKEFDLLILDEPTASMDIETTLSAEELVREYSERTGATVLIITHELKQARRVSDFVMFFDKGEIVSAGETNKTLDDPSDERLKEFIRFYGA